MNDSVISCPSHWIVALMPVLEANVCNVVHSYTSVVIVVYSIIIIRVACAYFYADLKSSCRQLMIIVLVV